MEKKKMKIFILLFLFSVTYINPAFAVAKEYAVITNLENNSSATVDDIKNLYLKELSNWPNGQKAIAYGRDKNSPEQIAFNKTILGLSDVQISNHWIYKKQVSGETPPRAISSKRMLLRQIAKRPGSFGIVAADQVNSGVKVVVTFSD